MSREQEIIDQIEKNTKLGIMYGPIAAVKEPQVTEKTIFTHKQFDEILSSTVEQIKNLALLKGGEYSGDFDRLANFRRNAESLGLDYRQIWGVYAAKHWDALMQYIKDLSDGKERRRLESLSGRADDLIVYLILFKCMLQECESNGTVKKVD